MKEDYNLLVVTVFPSGTKIKFKIPYSEFFETLSKDNQFRLDSWLEADNDKPYSEFYKTTSLTFNKDTYNLEVVELTPIKNGK